MHCTRKQFSNRTSLCSHRYILEVYIMDKKPKYVTSKTKINCNEEAIKERVQFFMAKKFVEHVNSLYKTPVVELKI